MRSFLILILFFCPTIFCMGQTRHIISASVLDSTSKERLEFVTVAVLKVKDSSLVSYTLTDKDGAFTLRNLHDNEPLRLLISCVGYKPLRIPVKFTNAEALNLGDLLLGSKTLTQVTIKGEIVPIIIKKDTIEFNAEAFKVRPNAVIQDLLKKLPGMQVDRDGIITFNGQDVSKVKVNGRDFFASDPRIATQNLDADMVASVQVYDDREDDPDHLKAPAEVKKIINLKFKKAFTESTFGNIAAGAGTQDRYKINGLFNKSINDLQVSILGNSNNLNNTDLNTTFASSGSRQTTNVNTNINDNFGKKAKLNMSYIVNHTSGDNNTNRNVAQFLHDTVLTANSANISHNLSTTHSLNGSLELLPNKNTNFKYTPTISYSTNTANNGSNSINYNNFTPILSQSANTGNSDGTNFRYSHNITFYKRLSKEGSSLTIGNSIQLSPNSSKAYSNNGLISYVSGLTSDTLQRLADNSSKNSSVSVSATYLYPFSKTISADVGITTSYSNSGSDLFTYDLDPVTGLYNVLLQTQSTSLSRNDWAETVSPSLIYRNKKVFFNASVKISDEHINNHFNSSLPDIDQHFLYFFPTASLSIGRLSLSFSQTTIQPSITNLQPITLVHDPLNSSTGNPDLKPMDLRSYRVSFLSYNTQSRLSSNVFALVSQQTNIIVQDRITTPQGATLSMPVNGKDRVTYSLTGSLRKAWKKSGLWDMSMSTNISSAYGHNYYLVNHQPGYQNTYFVNLTQQFSIGWNDIVEIAPSYNIYPAVTSYQLINLPKTSYVQQNLTIPLDVQLQNRFSGTVSYAYFYNPLVAPGFQRHTHLLNFSVARAFLQKDRGEFRISCYDLLNQSTSSTHFVTDNVVNDIQSQATKRYFLFSFKYKFSEVSKKGVR